MMAIIKERRLTQKERNLYPYILTVDTVALYNIWPVFYSSVARSVER